MNGEELFVTADGLYDTGRYAEAFECFMKSAEAGNPFSMTRIACMYADGEGVERDIARSIYWDTQAIEHGNMSSALNLATTYRVIGDIRESKKWLMLAADGGDGEAALQLAKLYMVSEKETETVRALLGKASQSLNLCEESQEEVAELLKAL